jgi:hypothetical protein
MGQMAITNYYSPNGSQAKSNNLNDNADKEGETTTHHYLTFN